MKHVGFAGRAPGRCAWIVLIAVFQLVWLLAYPISPVWAASNFFWALNKSFSPNAVVAGGTTTLTFTFVNKVVHAGIDLYFEDDLEATIPGMAVATPSNMSTTCPAGLVTAITFGGTPTKPVFTGGVGGTGGGGEASCTLSFDVVVPANTAAGVYTSTSGKFFRIVAGIGNILAVQDATATLEILPVTTVADTQEAASPVSQESANLDSQQDTFIPITINNQSHTMTDAVSGNVQSRLNNSGATPEVNQNGFFFQSDGTGQWLRQRNSALRRIKHHFDGSNERVREGDDVVLAYGPDERRFGSSPDWNVWIRGNGDFFDGDGESFDGYVLDVVTGVDRKVGDLALVGALVGYGRADFDTVATGTAGSFEANGIHLGLYGGIKLYDTLIFDGLVAYTRSDYDNTSGSTSGSFDADRITAAAHISGSFELHSLTIIPSVSFMYASEKQKAYTDSAGFVHASQTVNAGRFSVGPKVRLPSVRLVNGAIMPWVSARFEYDFSNNGAPAPTSGLPDFSNLSSARVSVGFDSSLGRDFRLKMTATGSGIGSGRYNAYGGDITLKKTF